MKRSKPAPSAAAPAPRRLAAWRDAHLHSLLSSLGRIAARPWSTLLTVGVIAIALALPAALMLLLDEVERFAGGLRDAREMALFLEPERDAAAAEALRAQLADDAELAAVQLRTPEQGLAELRAVPDLADALAVLDHNPLPYVLLVTPRPGVDEAALAARLGARPGVDFVQHDARWRARLGAWLAFGQRLAQVVAALLAAGVLLVVGNTVRLDIGSRADEIATLRLLGATDGFVRRPFLYLGAWYGALAGLLALALVGLARAALAGPVAALIASYEGDFVLASLPVAGAVALVALAVVLGWGGAFVAVGHHLRHAEGSE